jgi:hypothetical protein
MPLYTFINNFLNVLGQIANKLGLQKKSTVEFCYMIICSSVFMNSLVSGSNIEFSQYGSQILSINGVKTYAEYNEGTRICGQPA